METSRSRWLTALTLGTTTLVLKSVEKGLMLPSEQVAMEHALHSSEDNAPYPDLPLEKLRVIWAGMDERIESDEAWAIVGRDIVLMAVSSCLSRQANTALLGRLLSRYRFPLDHHAHGYDPIVAYCTLPQYRHEDLRYTDGGEKQALAALGVLVTHGADINACAPQGVSLLGRFLLDIHQQAQNLPIPHLTLENPEHYSMVEKLLSLKAEITHDNNIQSAWKAVELLASARSVNEYAMPISSYGAFSFQAQEMKKKLTPDREAYLLRKNSPQAPASSNPRRM